MPQFDTTYFVSQIFWMIISFGFLYLIMRTLICPMIEEVITERQNQIDDYLAQAESLNHQAEDLHQRIQTYHIQVEKEATERLQSAYTHLQQEAQEIEFKNEQALRQKIHKTEKMLAEENKTISETTNPLVNTISEKLIQNLTGGHS